MPVIEVIEPEEEQTEAVETEQVSTAEAEPESDEVEITIEGESATPDEVQEAPTWVKELRKQNREKDRELRELKDKLKGIEAPVKQTTLGPKPTLESVEFDAELYEKNLEDWYTRKREVEAQEEASKAEANKAQADYLKRLEAYAERKKATKLPNFDEAEETVKHTLSPIQQSIIVKHAKTPENIVYVLGTNSVKANELRAIQNPIEFALAVRDLEDKLKVTSKQAKPAPESPIKSGAAPVSGSDNKLEALRKKAEDTGDYSELAAYKRSLRANT